MKVVSWLILIAFIPVNESHASGQVSCFDYRYLKVSQAPIVGLDGIAQAGIGQDGYPVILYDPSVIFTESKLVEWFIFLHECGHHVLGHTALHGRADHEQEADCWAILRLSSFSEFTAHDMALIKLHLIIAGRADAMHLSGKQRADNLQLCTESTSQVAMRE